MGESWGRVGICPRRSELQGGKGFLQRKLQVQPPPWWTRTHSFMQMTSLHPHKQPWGLWVECSPENVWTNGAKSPSQEGAPSDQSVLMEQGWVRARWRSLVAWLS